MPDSSSLSMSCFTSGKGRCMNPSVAATFLNCRKHISRLRSLSSCICKICEHQEFAWTPHNHKRFPATKWHHSSASPNLSLLEKEAACGRVYLIANNGNEFLDVVEVCDLKNREDVPAGQLHTRSVHELEDVSPCRNLGVIIPDQLHTCARHVGCVVCPRKSSTSGDRRINEGVLIPLPLERQRS